MDKQFAIYLTGLIANDLNAAYFGMGLPSGVCEAIEGKLIKGDFEWVAKFIADRRAEIAQY